MLEIKRPIGITILASLYFVGVIFVAFAWWAPGGVEVTEKEGAQGVSFGIRYIAPYISTAFGIASVFLGYSMFKGIKVPIKIYSGYYFVLGIYNTILSSTIIIDSPNVVPELVLVKAFSALILGLIVTRYLSRNYVKQYLKRL